MTQQPKTETTAKERLALVEIFYQAAEIVETEISTSCCGALSVVDPTGAARDLFSKLFRLDAFSLPIQRVEFWFMEFNEPYDSDDVRDRRVLGLLWCAHMIESGEIG